MSRQPAILAPSSLSQHRDDSETKVPYDDLIDQYATSYKAYAVDPSNLNSSQASHHKHSYSLTQQSNESDVTVKDIKTDVSGESTERLDWGYPPPTTQPEQETRSLWSAFVPDSIACRLYLLTVLVETAVDLAIEAEIFVRLQQSRDDSGSDNVASLKMPVYLSIFAIAHLFQFLMALDAVHARNTLQFLALTIFNALFLVYAIIQIGEIRGELPPNTQGFSKVPIDVLTTVIPIVISVAELAYIGLGWKIYNEFGWKVYKFLGADRRIKAMYAYFQIYLCLVKFDVFFWVGFSVQFIWLVLSNHNAEYYLTIIALPLSIVLLVIGDQAARREMKWMMLVFMTGCAAAMVYFLYKLVKVLRFKSTSSFILVWQTLATFSVIAIVLLILTFVFAWIVMNNFGRGLKTRFANNIALKQRGKSVDLYRGTMANHPNRMSIE